MQLLITHGSMARTRVVQFQRWQLVLAALALVALLMALSGTIYHFVFLKAAREGWPVVSPLVRLVVRDEIAQRERFMRDNLDALASGGRDAGRMVSGPLGEQVSGLASMALSAGAPPGMGGALITLHARCRQELDESLMRCSKWRAALTS
jgi:hypothetical protein